MKRIILVLGLLALSGSFLVSCDRDETCPAKTTSDVKNDKNDKDDKDDNSISVKNLAASGKFTLINTVKLEGTKIIPLGDLIFVNAYTFGTNGKYHYEHTLSEKFPTEEKDYEYELKGNKLILHNGGDNEDENGVTEYEIVKFEKGKLLQLKRIIVSVGDDGKKHEDVYLSELKVLKKETK